MVMNQLYDQGRGHNLTRVDSTWKAQLEPISYGDGIGFVVAESYAHTRSFNFTREDTTKDKTYPLHHPSQSVHNGVPSLARSSVV